MEAQPAHSRPVRDIHRVYTTTATTTTTNNDNNDSNKNHGHSHSHNDYNHHTHMCVYTPGLADTATEW